MNIEPGSAWNEFDDAVEEAVKLAKAVPHPVYMVLQPNNVPMPRSDNPLPHMQRVFRLVPDNVKLFFVVMGKSGFFERSIIDVVGRFAVNKKLRAVSAEEDAYRMIANQTVAV